MRRLIRGIAFAMVAVGLLLGLAWLACLPAGGLMFALPYVFLIPGLILLAGGAALVVATRARPAAGDHDPADAP